MEGEDRGNTHTQTHMHIRMHKYTQTKGLVTRKLPYEILKSYRFVKI